MDYLPNHIMNYSADKLGYYLVGNYKTYRKHLAINEQRRTNAGVQWVFNDTEFGQFNWTTCPTKSLNDLYSERAHTLRETYNNLVLFYSGGSDSQVILDTFLKNNIHIDHIVCCHSTKGDNSPYGYFSEEITRVAKPYLDSVADKLTHTSIHYVDQTDSILNGFTHADWWVDHNNALTPNCVMRSRLRDWYIPLRNLIETGKSTGFIWGRDKPKILDDNGRYYTMFNDHNDNNTSPYSQSRAAHGWYDEFFYQDPAFPNIISRQIHEVINRLAERSISDEFFQTAYTENGLCPHTGKYLTNLGICHVIYPDWNIRTFSNGKNPSMIWGARDRWFFDHYTSTPAYQNWRGAVNHLNTVLAHEIPGLNWLNDEPTFRGIKGCITPRYYLT